LTLTRLSSRFTTVGGPAPRFPTAFPAAQTNLTPRLSLPRRAIRLDFLSVGKAMIRVQEGEVEHAAGVPKGEAPRAA
jgi:hypothetical protein